MPSHSTSSQATGRNSRRPWAISVVVVVATLLLLAGRPVWAANGSAEINQTVPTVTPRPPVDTPTPEDKKDDKNEDNNNQAENPPPAAPEVTPEPTQAAPSALTASVNAVTLNVRQGPGTNFPVVGRLSQTSVITVEGRNEAADWWVVCCVPETDTRGWVSAGLVTPNFGAEQAAAVPVVAAPEPPPTPVATPTPVVTATPVPGSKQGSVTAVTLNVRNGPSTDSDVVGKLREGNAVSVLGRNEAGDWLFVCCVPNSETRGWVSAEFVAPAFTAADLEVSPGGEAAPAEGTSTPESPAATTETTDTTAAGATSPLAVTIMQLPPFAVQGREIVLLYTIRNNGSDAATNVALSSELPGPLTFVSASASGDGQVAPQGAEGPAKINVTWPSVPANDAVTATVRVRVAPDVPNGTTFPDLASVTADGGLNAVGGIRIGMPPSLLPEFW